MQYSHITTWTVAFPHNEVATETIIPRNVEGSASEIVEVYVGEVVGPVLDGIALTRLEGSRCSPDETRRSKQYAR